MRKPGKVTWPRDGLSLGQFGLGRRSRSNPRPLHESGGHRLGLDFRQLALRLDDLELQLVAEVGHDLVLELLEVDRLALAAIGYLDQMPAKLGLDGIGD